MENTSKFTGKMLGYLGVSIVVGLISSITLGIATPWAICYLQSWISKHTYVDGKQLKFDGTGMQLFGSYIKWFLLTIITFGIYGLWLPVKIQEWTASHTHFADAE